jgi:hypothetical protein
MFHYAPFYPPSTNNIYSPHKPVGYSTIFITNPRFNYFAYAPFYPPSTKNIHSPPNPLGYSIIFLTNPPSNFYLYAPFYPRSTKKIHSQPSSWRYSPYSLLIHVQTSWCILLFIYQVLITVHPILYVQVTYSWRMNPHSFYFKNAPFHLPYNGNIPTIQNPLGYSTFLILFCICSYSSMHYRKYSQSTKSFRLKYHFPDESTFKLLQKCSFWSTKYWKYSESTKSFML